MSITRYTESGPFPVTAPRLPHFSLSRELVTDFVLTFARAEFALKWAGCHKRGNGDSVEADWLVYAARVQPRFDQLKATEAAPAIDLLFRAPPMKQILKGGALDWKDSPCATDSESRRLAIMIRRVRNNLFHGAKCWPEIANPARDTPLVKAALIALPYYLALDAKVREAYESDDPRP